MKNLAELLKAWVRDIFIVVLALGFVEIVIPTGNMKKYINFIFSIIILGVVLSPIGYFRDADDFKESLTGECDLLINENIENNVNNKAEYKTSANELDESNNRMIESVYKEKIVEEVRACISEYFPQLSIDNVEIYFSETDKKSDIELTSVNKIVITGGKTEYVNNIIRCVAQRLGIEDERVSYIIPG